MDRFDIVDFHSHILPCADHGSSSVAMSLKQLKLASEAGVKRIIATPHFYPHKHTLDRFLERRDECARELYEACNGELPEVKIGAEVLLCDGLDKFPGLEKLCLCGTNYILIELPFADFRNEYCDTVEKIMKLGFKVVLAHVDRYSKDNIEQLIDIGVDKLQVNADSLDKMFKPKHVLDWAKNGYVVALGSDIHGEDTKAYKHFAKAKNVLASSIDIIRTESDKIFDTMK